MGRTLDCTMSWNVKVGEGLPLFIGWRAKPNYVPTSRLSHVFSWVGFLAYTIRQVFISVRPGFNAICSENLRVQLSRVTIRKPHPRLPTYVPCHALVAARHTDVGTDTTFRAIVHVVCVRGLFEGAGGAHPSAP